MLCFRGTKKYVVKYSISWSNKAWIALATGEFPDPSLDGSGCQSEENVHDDFVPVRARYFRLTGFTYWDRGVALQYVLLE